MHEGVVLDRKLIDLIVACSEDESYSSVLQVVNEGGSPRGLREDHPARELRAVWDKLSTYNGPNGQCLLCDGRIFVPQALRAQYLTELHHYHPSADSMWLEAREKIWWPGIRGEIWNKYKSCMVCQTVQRLNYEPPPMTINQELAASHGRVACGLGLSKQEALPCCG